MFHMPEGGGEGRSKCRGRRSNVLWGWAWERLHRLLEQLAEVANTRSSTTPTCRRNGEPGSSLEVCHGATWEWVETGRLAGLQEVMRVSDRLEPRVEVVVAGHRYA